MGFAIGVADVVLSARQHTPLGDLVFGTVTVTITIATGLVVWAARPESRMGMLITAWGICGFLADTVGLLPDSRVLVTIGWPLFLLFSAVYAHMVLAYPTGRVVDRIDRAAVGIIYVAVILWAVPLLTMLRPRDCSDCSPRVPSLLFIGEISFLNRFGQAFAGLFIVLGAIFVGLIARRIRRASPGVRRTLWPLALAAGFGAAQFIARSVSQLFQLSSWQEPLVWVDRASGIAVPVALAVGVLSTRRARGTCRKARRRAGERGAWRCPRRPGEGCR